MISSTATTRAVTSSSRVSAPSKTADRSAVIAAGPVTWAVTPSGRSVAHHVPEVGHRLGDRRVALGVEGGHAERGRAVLARLQRDPAPGGVREGLADRPQRRPVELLPVGRGVEHDGGGRVAGGELVLELDHAGAVVAGRQRVDGLGGRGGLADERQHGGGRGQEEQEQGDGAARSQAGAGLGQRRLASQVTKKIAKKVSKLVKDTARRPPASPVEARVGLPAESLQTPSLQLLRELLDVAAQVPPAVARRADLSHNELQTLELLFEGPTGPGRPRPAPRRHHRGVVRASSPGSRPGATSRARPHVTDGRRHQVAITESGAAEVIGHLAPMFAGLHEVDAGLDDDERAVVEAYLVGTIAALRRLL